MWGLEFELETRLELALETELQFEPELEMGLGSELAWEFVLAKDQKEKSQGRSYPSP